MRYLSMKKQADGYYLPWVTGNAWHSLYGVGSSEDLEASEDAVWCPARRIDKEPGASLPFLGGGW